MTDLDKTIETYTEGSGALAKRSIVDLRARLAIVTRVIREAQADGDERWRNVVPQQRRINAVLTAKLKERRQEHGETEPPSITVGMKPGRLKATRLSVGG